MNKISITLAFCLLLMSISGCVSSNRSPENKIVADAINSLRNELPIHFEGLGKVREVDYEGNTVIFRMRIRDEASSGMSVTKINENHYLAKEIVTIQIGVMNVQTKEALKAIANELHGLKIQISGSTSSRNGEIELSPNDLKLAINNAQNISADVFSLKMVAMTTRLMLPAQVDQVTTWIDTRLTNDSFEYIYEIDDKNIDMSSIDVDAMKREELNMLIQNMDVLGNVVKCCKSTHRNLIIKYIGSNFNSTIQVVLTPTDLDEVFNN